MSRERGHALMDVLFCLTIIGGFGTALYVATLPPVALYAVALPALIYGVIFGAYRVPSLWRESENRP